MQAGHVREHETITVDPIGVLGVEVHELVEQNVGDGGHAHGGTGVTRVGLGGGINLVAALVEFKSWCIHRSAVVFRSIERALPLQCPPKDLAAVAGTEETYRENTDGVNRQRIQIGVTHDGRF